MVSNKWEFTLVDGKLFISAEPPEDGQVVLSAQAAYDLLEFLYQQHETLYEAAHPQNETTQKLQAISRPHEKEDQ